MKFQGFREWLVLNEGGGAIPSSRSMTWEEAQEVYDWVKKTIVPELGISEEDVDVIGSYGKKLAGETHGDLDIVISAKALMEKNELSQDQLLDFLDDTLSGLGFETKKMVGFKQVSFGAPIPETDDIAQVDFMLSSDLDWSRFVYHSPDFRKGESRYKGSYRNTLLMAIITETSKEILKQTPEGDVEELESNVIRYPEGIWKSRRSWAGKKGLIKTPKLLKDFDKLITTNPQEVANLVAGPGYKPEDILTFEGLWSIVVDPNYIYADKIEDIMKKYAGNLRVQEMPYPQEAIEAFPKIFVEDEG